MFDQGLAGAETSFVDEVRVGGEVEEEPAESVDVAGIDLPSAAVALDDEGGGWLAWAR